MKRFRHAIKRFAAGWYPTWEATMQPGVGDAPQFAFTTLSLAPHSVIDGAIYAPQHPLPLPSAPQVKHMQQHRLDGLPLAAGTVSPQGLLDPAAANLTPLTK